MKIKTWELKKRKDPLKFHYTEDLSALAKEFPQIKKITPVNINGTATELAGLYKVKGVMETTLSMECSKCLSDFDYLLKAEFEELFVSEEVETNFTDDEDDENIHALENDEIDLSTIIEEQFIVNIPFIPVCSTDCKGLCVVCGTNLNEETCGCKVEKIDPRLADLQKWFDQMDRKE